MNHSVISSFSCRTTGGFWPAASPGAEPCPKPEARLSIRPKNAIRRMRRWRQGPRHTGPIEEEEGLCGLAGWVPLCVRMFVLAISLSVSVKDIMCDFCVYGKPLFICRTDGAAKGMASICGWLLEREVLFFCSYRCLVFAMIPVLRIL